MLCLCWVHDFSYNFSLFIFDIFLKKTQNSENEKNEEKNEKNKTKHYRDKLLLQ